MFKGDACHYSGREHAPFNVQVELPRKHWSAFLRPVNFVSTGFESLFALKMEVKDGREAWKPIW